MGQTRTTQLARSASQERRAHDDGTSRGGLGDSEAGPATRTSESQRRAAMPNNVDDLCQTTLKVAFEVRHLCLPSLEAAYVENQVRPDSKRD